MRELTIHRLYFTQSACYKTAKTGQPAGIQVHSTIRANPYLHRYVGPDDGLLGPNQYNNTHNRPDALVCANAYIGLLADGKTVAVYQTLPWEKHCWLSGSGSGKTSANGAGFIGFETCWDSANSTAYFMNAVWDKSINLCAYLCWKFNIDVDKAVRDHMELHEMGMANNHGDITDWLKTHGKNMDAYRAEIKKAMAEGVRVKYIEGAQTWYDGPEGEPEKREETAMNRRMRVVGDGYLNLRSAPNINAESIGKLSPGDIVTKKAEYPDGWAFVQTEGKQGYCMAFYLEYVPEDDAVEPPNDAVKPSDEQRELLSEIMAITERLRELEDRLSKSIFC